MPRSCVATKIKTKLQRVYIVSHINYLSNVNKKKGIALIGTLKC